MKDLTWLSDPEPAKGPEEAPAEMPIILLGDAGGGGDSETVEVSANRIYYYCEVDRREALKFNKALENLEKKNMKGFIQVKNLMLANYVIKNFDWLIN